MGSGLLRYAPSKNHHLLFHVSFRFRNDPLRTPRQYWLGEHLWPAHAGLFIILPIFALYARSCRAGKVILIGLHSARTADAGDPADSGGWLSTVTGASRSSLSVVAVRGGQFHRGVGG